MSGDKPLLAPLVTLRGGIITAVPQIGLWLEVPRNVFRSGPGHLDVASSTPSWPQQSIEDDEAGNDESQADGQDIAHTTQGH